MSTSLFPHAGNPLGSLAVATVVFVVSALFVIVLLRPTAPSRSRVLLASDLGDEGKRLSAAFAPVTTADLPLVLEWLGDPDSHIR